MDEVLYNANPLPDLTPEAYADLKASIARDGMTYPVIRSSGPACEGEIVDGFNRIRIAEELGIRVPYQGRPFHSEAEFRICQIDLNASRRQLTDPQRVQLALDRVPWERQLAAARRGISQSTLVGKSDASRRTGRATELSALAVGVKRKTVEKAAFVREHMPALYAQYQKGGVSIDRVFKQTRKTLGIDTHATLAKAVSKKVGAWPTGTYASIVIDPPWRGNREIGGSAVGHREIALAPVADLLGDLGVVYLWTPIANAGEALELLAGWGLTVAGAIHWVHDHAQRGSFLHEQAELCIVGIHGRVVPATAVPLNVVTGAADSISRLPKAFFSLVESIRPGKALVMFGDVSRDHWTSWQPVAPSNGKATKATVAA